jgi:hypothetical protein
MSFYCFTLAGTDPVRLPCRIAFLCWKNLFVRSASFWNTRIHGGSGTLTPTTKYREGKTNFCFIQKKTLRIRVYSSSFFAYFSMVIKCQGNASRMRKKNFLKRRDYSTGFSINVL